MPLRQIGYNLTLIMNYHYSISVTKSMIYLSEVVVKYLLNNKCQITIQITYFQTKKLPVLFLLCQCVFQ